MIKSAVLPQYMLITVDRPTDSPADRRNEHRTQPVRIGRLCYIMWLIIKEAFGHTMSLSLTQVTGILVDRKTNINCK